MKDGRKEGRWWRKKVGRKASVGRKEGGKVVRVVKDGRKEGGGGKG